MSMRYSTKYKFLFFILIILFTSCKAPYFALGTSEEVWLKKSPGSKLIEKNNSGTIYLRGWSLGYYYFSPEGKLIQIDQGVRTRRPDIVIENRY
jgi:hypothetical protein